MNLQLILLQKKSNSWSTDIKGYLVDWLHNNWCLQDVTWSQSCSLSHMFPSPIWLYLSLSLYLSISISLSLSLPISVPSELQTMATHSQRLLMLLWEWQLLRRTPQHSEAPMWDKWMRSSQSISKSSVWLQPKQTLLVRFHTLWKASTLQRHSSKLTKTPELSPSSVIYAMTHLGEISTLWGFVFLISMEIYHRLIGVFFGINKIWRRA